MAVGFFNERSRRLGLDAEATSVGLWRDGEPATPEGIAVMAAHGIDTTHHRSRILSTEHLGGADLVIGLAREHLREAVVLDNDTMPRAFTLKELVRRAEADGGARRSDQNESVADWARRLSSSRTTQDLLGAHSDDDVDDPIGKPRKAYERTADEIAGLVDRLVARMYPDVDSERATA